MAFEFSVRFGRRSSKAAVENQRSAPSPPQKVFVEREDKFTEYSPDAPAQLSMLNDLLYGGHSAYNFIEMFYCLPEVYSAVHQIASRVADATWQLKRMSNDEVIYTDEKFNQLFSKPNPIMPMNQFVYQAVCYEILTGRQFFYLNKPDTLPDEYKSVLTWSNLPAPYVKVDMKKVDPYSATEIEDLISRYTAPVNGRERIFEAENVIPIINFDLKKGVDFNAANSYLRGADKAIKNLIPVYTARGVIYIKRGALGFIVSRKSDESGSVPLTKTEKKEIEDDYNKTYGLSEEQNQIGITGMPVDFIRTAMTIEEMQPFDETLSDAVAIYACLKIPRHLVPSRDASTFSNADADMKAFYENVIIPWAKKYADAWTEGLGLRRDFKKYVFADYSHIGLLQDNKKDKAAVDYQNATTGILLYKEGVITKNQRNALLGYESIGAEGDVFSTDPNNESPAADRMPVGTLTALITLVSNPAVDPIAKENTLIAIFGLAPDVAKKLSVSKPVNNDPNTPPGDPEAEGKGAGNQPPFNSN